jgi:hypothetical protein
MSQSDKSYGETRHHTATVPGITGQTLTGYEICGIGLLDGRLEQHGDV